VSITRDLKLSEMMTQWMYALKIYIHRGAFFDPEWTKPLTLFVLFNGEKLK
jgi:hypothetical protein